MISILIRVKQINYGLIHDRGEQKFLFALLGDGIGICFLTNFGNFWDFEDAKDFQILENSKNF